MQPATKQTVAIGTVVGGIAGTAIYVVTPTWSKDKRALVVVLGGIATGTLAAGVTALRQEGVGVDMALVSITALCVSTTGLVVALLKK